LNFRSFHQRRLFFQGTASFLLQPLKQQAGAVLGCSGHATSAKLDWLMNQSLDQHDPQ